MEKLLLVFLTETLIILPVVFGTHFHGYDSYKKYYESLKQPKQAISPYDSIKVFYNSESGNLGNRMLADTTKSQDKWQDKNDGDDYSQVPRCDFMRQTFCEDVPNYPQEYINEILAKNATLMHYCHEDVIELIPRVNTDEEPLCLSSERLIRPKTAMNQNNEWMYILQSNQENFYQSIRIEACLEENSKCRIIDGFAEGYVTSCKQKYIYRELSAINDKGEAIRDYFAVPASCCCSVQFNAFNK